MVVRLDQYWHHGIMTPTYIQIIFSSYVMYVIKVPKQAGLHYLYALTSNCRYAQSPQ